MQLSDKSWREECIQQIACAYLGMNNIFHRAPVNENYLTVMQDVECVESWFTIFNEIKKTMDLENRCMQIENKNPAPLIFSQAIENNTPLQQPDVRTEKKSVPKAYQ